MIVVPVLRQVPVLVVHALEPHIAENSNQQPIGQGGRLVSKKVVNCVKRYMLKTTRIEPTSSEMMAQKLGPT